MKKELDGIFSMNACGSVLIVVVLCYDLNTISVACKVSLYGQGFVHLTFVTVMKSGPNITPVTP